VSQAIHAYWIFLEREEDTNESKYILRTMYTAGLILSIVATAGMIEYYLKRQKRLFRAR
jgi:hypothetical protein